ncbi:MAG: conjugal transfer protein TraX [Firmicutes bacterium]|nr:conjugal transfer protein TraX [Bacillota bacterium]
MTAKPRGLSGSALKLIAIVAMTVDHATWVFLPGYRTDALTLALHIIGRLAAPTMMFFIAEGYYHTRDVKKYAGRMLLFALVSHFGYGLLFNKNLVPFRVIAPNQTGILWGLSMGLIALAVYKSERLRAWQKWPLIGLCLLAAYPANWSTPAAAAVLLMGIFRGNFKKQMLGMTLCVAVYAAIYVLTIQPLYGLLQMTVVLAIPLLYSYNGRRGAGGKAMKWLFYVYYPAHMFILAFVKHFILK